MDFQVQEIRMLSFLSLNRISDENSKIAFSLLSQIFKMDENSSDKIIYPDLDYGITSILLKLAILNDDNYKKEFLLEDLDFYSTEIGEMNFINIPRIVNKKYITKDFQLLDEEIKDISMQLKFDISSLLRIFQKLNLESLLLDECLHFNKNAKDLRNKINKHCFCKNFKDEIFYIKEKEVFKKIFKISFSLKGLKIISIETTNSSLLNDDDFLTEMTTQINDNFSLDLNSEDAKKDIDNFFKTVDLLIY